MKHSDIIVHKHFNHIVESIYRYIEARKLVITSAKEILFQLCKSNLRLHLATLHQEAHIVIAQLEVDLARSRYKHKLKSR